MKKEFAMKMKFVIVCFLFVFLSACGVNTSITSSSKKRNVAESILVNEFFIRNKQGICYSIVTSVSYVVNEVVSHTVVPCEKVEQNLLFDEYKK